MPPKSKDKTPVESPPQEEETPPVEEEPKPPPEDEITELSTGLKLLLRPKDVEQFWSLKSEPAQQEKFLDDHLGLVETFPKTAQRDIVRDFTIYNLAHAQSICLSSRQGAVFQSIMHQVLDMMRTEAAALDAKPQDMCSASTCFAHFEKLILMHSVSEPPDRLDVFRASEARLLADFASQTLFQHFLLYQYCVNFDREVETMRACMSLERPLPPLDLKAADLMPTRKSQEVSKADSGLGGEDASKVKEDLTEEEEIDRLVQEKLAETQAKLQEKLVKREEAFQQRLEEMKSGGKK